MKKFGLDYLFREALLLCVGRLSLWAQPEKKEQEKFFFGRRSQSRAATTTTLFVRACVRAHSDSEQKRTQSCVFSYVVRMFYFYLCLCVYLKRKKN